MSPLSLATMLTRARLAARTGSGILDIFAIAAFSVSAWLTLTTLGGVAMFYSRQDAINQAVVREFNGTLDTEVIGSIYFSLSIVALALLIVPLTSLGGGAARLGAGGRERRLASLRLIGMSARQVIVMSIVESMIQASLGFVLGLGLYYVTLPAWKNITFGTLPISSYDMLLPWWVQCLTYLLVIVIAVVSTIVGLQRVSISPLGVAQRIIPAKVKMWRMGIVVTTLIILVYVTSTFTVSRAMLGSIISIAVAFVLFFGGIAIAGPLFIQLTMRPLVFTGSPARLVGIRRVVSDSRAAWRNISAVALIGAVATLVTTLTVVSIDAPDKAVERSYVAMVSHDITQGVYIAFAFALIIGAVSTSIHQVSDVFDRAEESRALVYVGTPLATLIRARFIQVMYPLIAVLIIVSVLSAIPALINPVMGNWDNLRVLLIMMGLGIGLTLGCVAVTIPIQRRIVAMRVRRND
ncbi:FtsX-like permease family protein [Arcanobacterium pinnipediorum]|uniref:FtsX-like permease family protein n=1 Tax=Arcanobacterium pinnipediorum TaxID=1503041 RepID=A0ABY5AL09_9ACTO|nr:FtsX-like permease family protein [Arcanobacterium pinnipediorum]USR79898.1 hypothetical protein NG665_02640 [Arcanobacterium pinnipediorum]